MRFFAHRETAVSLMMPSVLTLRQPILTALLIWLRKLKPIWLLLLLMIRLLQVWLTLLMRQDLKHSVHVQMQQLSKALRFFQRNLCKNIIFRLLNIKCLTMPKKQLIILRKETNFLLLLRQTALHSAKV